MIEYIDNNQTLNISSSKLLKRYFSESPKGSIQTDNRFQKIVKKSKSFAKLGRYHSQTGTMLLFYPCLFGVALGAPAPLSLPLSNFNILFWLVLGQSALFLFGAFNLRSAGCAVNDSFDKDLDSKVERTRDRPLAAGLLTQKEALGFTAAHLTGGLFVLAK